MPQAAPEPQAEQEAAAALHQSPLALETAPGDLSVPTLPGERLRGRGHQGHDPWQAALGSVLSPLEVGKHWFYGELSKLAPVQTKQGYETKELRERLGLKKTSKKLAEVWEAHCVDAWVLAHSAVGGHKNPDNRRVVCIAPLNWHHRQLHRFEPEKRGKRKFYGGTLSQGIKRGTLVKHPRWGKAYVGGTMHGQLSLHDLQTGKRLTQSAKVADCRPIKLVRWRTRLVPLFPTT